MTKRIISLFAVCVMLLAQLPVPISVNPGGGAGGGSGDVTGPVSSSNNGLVVFNGTSGKAIQQWSGGDGVVVVTSGVVSVSSLSGVPDLFVTRTAPTVLSIAVGKAGFGNNTFVYTSTATATISAGTGTAYIYVTPGGTLTVGHNGLTFVCVNCTETSGITSFPADVVVSATATATAGTWDVSGVTDLRAPLHSTPVLAGTGLSSSYVNGVKTLDADFTLIPQFGTGTSVPGSGFAYGKLFFKTDEPSGQKLFYSTGSAYEQVTGGGATPSIFDLTKYQLVDRFPTGSSIGSGGNIGQFHWSTAISSSGNITDYNGATDSSWDGGVTLTTGTTAGGAMHIYLRSCLDQQRCFNDLTSKVWRMDVLFRTPDATNTGAAYRLQFLADPTSPTSATGNRMALRYIEGTDSAWIFWQPSGTACTASAAPSASEYYILRMTGSGTSTISVQLLHSTTSYQAASADLFSSCTFTMPSASLSPQFGVHNQSTAAAIRINIGAFFFEKTY